MTERSFQILKVQTRIRNLVFESPHMDPTALTNTTIVPADRFGGTVEGLVSPRLTDCRRFWLRMVASCLWGTAVLLLWVIVWEMEGCTNCRRRRSPWTNIPPKQPRIFNCSPSCIQRHQNSLNRRWKNVIPIRLQYLCPYRVYAGFGEQWVGWMNSLLGESGFRRVH